MIFPTSELVAIRWVFQVHPTAAADDWARMRRIDTVSFALDTISSAPHVLLPVGHVLENYSWACC